MRIITRTYTGGRPTLYTKPGGAVARKDYDVVDLLPVFVYSAIRICVERGVSAEMYAYGL